VIKLMLDTNICIYILKQRPDSVLKALQRYKIGDIGVSMIVYGELVYGAYKSLKKIENLAAIEMLMDMLELMPVNEEVIHHYATVRSELAKQGQIIGANDLWIAAHALSLDIPLVINNAKEFCKVPNLECLNWV